MNFFGKSPKPHLSIAALCVAAFCVCWALGVAASAGFLLAAAFLFFSFACSKIEKLKSLTYTMFIFCLVCVAMFYPALLRKWGGVTLITLIPVVMQVMMFGVGSQMSLEEFKGIARMPRAVIIGLVCQTFIMPLLGFALARLVAFDGGQIAASMGLAHDGQVDPARAAALSGAISGGIMLIACSPSGLASNVMCFLAKGNLALSVTIAAFATLLAPIRTPLFMKVLAGTMVQVDVPAMMGDVIRMLIYPIMAGLLFNAAATLKPRRKTLREALLFFVIIVVLQAAVGLARGHGAAGIARDIALTVLFVHVLAPLAGFVLSLFTKGSAEAVKKGMAFFSMAAVCTSLTIITAAYRDGLLCIGIMMIVVMTVQNCGGYLVGYWASRAMRLDERSCRTVAFEVGQQNGALANSLVAGLPIDAAMKALMGVAPMVFGMLQNITGSALATWWRGIPIRGENEKPEDLKA